MQETIQNSVYRYRSKAGVTQQDLAEAVGVTRQTVIAIEKGNYVPSVLLALKIAQYFDAAVENRRDIESIIIAAILLVLADLLFNPFGLFMSNMMVMVIAAGLITVFALFAGLVWQEKPQDERESIHRMATDRIAFLVGVGVLVAVIVAQGFRHQVPSWAVATLGAMVLAKALVRIYFQVRH